MTMELIFFVGFENEFDLYFREQILMASGDGEGDVDGSHNANGNSNGNGAAFSVFHSIQLMIISFFCAILRSF